MLKKRFLTSFFRIGRPNRMTRLTTPMRAISGLAWASLSGISRRISSGSPLADLADGDGELLEHDDHADRRQHAVDGRGGEELAQDARADQAEDDLNDARDDADGERHR